MITYVPQFMSTTEPLIVDVFCMPWSIQGEWAHIHTRDTKDQRSLEMFFRVINARIKQEGWIIWNSTKYLRLRWTHPLFED